MISGLYFAPCPYKKIDLPAVNSHDWHSWMCNDVF